MRIKVFTVYYGELPAYFPLWLKTCSTNDWIDFCVITDQDVCDLPKNVSLIKMAWDDLKARFEEVLGFEICLDKPYKLCDYRPLYGQAFKDYLDGYDFWGHCDIDVIWGDLALFLTPDILERHDRIGAFGAFSLYRNNNEMNNLYKEKGSLFNYKTVYRHKENYIFDEMPGMNSICMKQAVSWYLKLKIVELRTNLDRTGWSAISRPEVFVWDTGKVFCYYVEDYEPECVEVAYIHFSGKNPNVSDLAELYKTNSFLLFSDQVKYRYNKLDSANSIIKQSDFISVENDKKQKRMHKLHKWQKFFHYSLNEKILRVLIKAKIRQFYHWKNKNE